MQGMHISRVARNGAADLFSTRRQSASVGRKMKREPSKKKVWGGGGCVRMSDREFPSHLLPPLRGGGDDKEEEKNG
jgi:hypothetical protein